MLEEEALTKLYTISEMLFGREHFSLPTQTLRTSPQNHSQHALNYSLPQSYISLRNKIYLLKTFTFPESTAPQPLQTRYN